MRQFCLSLQVPIRPLDRTCACYVEAERMEQRSVSLKDQSKLQSGSTQTLLFCLSLCQQAQREAGGERRLPLNDCQVNQLKMKRFCKGWNRFCKKGRWGLPKQGAKKARRRGFDPPGAVYRYFHGSSSSTILHSTSRRNQIPAHVLKVNCVIVSQKETATLSGRISDRGALWLRSPSLSPACGGLPTQTCTPHPPSSSLVFWGRERFSYDERFCKGNWKQDLCCTLWIYI